MSEWKPREIRRFKLPRARWRLAAPSHARSRVATDCSHRRGVETRSRPVMTRCSTTLNVGEANGSKLPSVKWDVPASSRLLGLTIAAYRNLLISVRKEVKPLSEQKKAQREPAFGYTRTSSATNLGEDKDSVPRQRRAIRSYANRAGYKVTQWFDDGDVKGADPIDARPGFGEMIETIAANGCRTIIVERADRFARGLVVQETGYQRLKAEGITLIAVDSPDCFTDTTPMAVLICQILGAVAQFDKAMTVFKLRGARDKKRAKYGKCEGRKSILERDPRIVEAAKALAQGKLSLRQISAALTGGEAMKFGQDLLDAAVADP
jgi:DNA invertase Pin-like site-specific DNA recombinase